MRITDIREKSVKLDVNIRNAVFSFDDMTTSIVAVITDVIRDGSPVAGFAFNSTGRYACGGQMRDRLIPRILRQKPDSLLDAERGNFDPEAIFHAMMFGEKPGGDMERSVGIGTIEVALWDAMAKIEEKPLHKLIAERFGTGDTPERMFCYVGGGWYSPNETSESLKDEMRSYLDQGYTLVKAKIGGLPIDDDVRRIETILSVLEGGHQLAVDANCGLSPEVALEYAGRLKSHGLRWFEEPVHPIDFEATSAFVKAYGNPTATGENLFSAEDFRNLLRYGSFRPGTDILNIDIPQSYGIGMCARTLDMARSFGWAASSFVPHGGNQMSLACALGFGMGMCESYPNVFGPFSGYADDARIENGYIRAPQLPGVGFEGQSELYGLFKELTSA
ncbi:MAG: enolase C-terminal domain-like protein [Rhodospirillales bacterium]|jgi:L-alanine-DL-glutamate epimerase-like enolase superfamily enzyme|nr:mandelate racemase [Rhodospirillaceae bacterium]MDP6427959.1 enolase C-terminal domain-like protein [Rhodospirillales bacterium]MDP6645995.1 enolase C-terminal domain-like protein [Rhodospirillales bacterium]